MAGPGAWFAEGGPFMVPILLLDLAVVLGLLLAWIVALYGRIRGRSGFVIRALPALTLLGAMLPVVLGTVAYLQGRSQVLDAVRQAPSGLRSELLQAGLEAALIPLHFGGVSTVLLGGLAVLAVAIAPWVKRH